MQRPPDRVRRAICGALAFTAVAGVLATAGPATAGTGPPNFVTYIGEASSATGAALAQGDCDVNGDGYDDAIVGAWFWDKLPTTSNEGTTYVLFGGPSPAAATSPTRRRLRSRSTAPHPATSLGSLSGAPGT